MKVLVKLVLTMSVMAFVQNKSSAIATKKVMQPAMPSSTPDVTNIPIESAGTQTSGVLRTT